MAVCNKNLFRKIVIPLLKQNYKSKPNFQRSYNFPQCAAFHINAQNWAKVAFNLSDIGEGIREVVVKEWFIKVGDKVNQFDNICEVQSDKASVTITSRYDGIITKLHYNVEEIALVGKPLVDLETNDQSATSREINVESVKSTSTSNNNINIDNESESESSDSDYAIRVPCIPSVRRLATQYKIDLNIIKGTGKDGRILKEDLLNYIENMKNAQNKIIEKRGGPSPSSCDRTEAIRGFQKAMVKTMTDSLKIPHFIYSDEISVSRLNKIRQETKDTFQEKLKIKLTLMPFFIKAISNSLLSYPILNSTIDEKCENVTYLASHNIGVAMDTANGLAVPVIRNVEKLSIVQIAHELNRLLQSGKNGSFSLNELTGGTITLSNIGSIGGTYTKPVILPPQVAIIAIGATKLLPRFDQSNNVIPEQIISMSAAGDHRVIDGATMAKFINAWKKQIENPNLLFLNL